MLGKKLACVFDRYRWFVITDIGVVRLCFFLGSDEGIEQIPWPSASTGKMFDRSDHLITSAICSNFKTKQFAMLNDLELSVRSPRDGYKSEEIIRLPDRYSKSHAWVDHLIAFQKLSLNGLSTIHASCIDAII